jgi:diguanylate cyclase (GGDEF)-like protein
VDSGIPPSVEDPESLRRARIILSFTLVLIVLGVEAVVFFSWALPTHLAQPVAVSLIAGLMLTLAIPTVFRRRGSLSLGANLVIAGSYVVITTSFVMLGGIRAPLLHWLALLPLLAALMGARASAWGWAGVGFATVGVFTLLDIGGHEFPDQLGLATLQGATLWAQRFVDVGSWIAVLLTVALLYEVHRKQQTRQLAEQNAQLESEVEQRGRAEERTHYLAYFDELTTLPNKRLFEHYLQAALDHAPRIEKMVAVLFLDLDGFKQVNDSHGHALGDSLLQQVALRLKSCVRMSDVATRGRVEEPGVVSRLAGDEFTILLTCIRDHGEAGIVSQRILDCMEAPFLLGDHEIFITASIGIALFPSAGEGLEDMLRSADLAMYHAKERGKNTYQFFEESMNLDIVRHSTVAADLRKGLDRGEYELHFQPIVAARSHDVVGLEALTRWNHPDRGSVPAREFIEVAEKSGLILPLGDWILHEACRQYAEWQSAGIAPARIAINVSGPQLRRGTFLKTALDALRDFAIDPSCLELEVTEGAMLVDEAEASRCLAELKDLGVRVALDDFGTGYSSLSYVKRFPVDSLKIDRSFVHNIETMTEAQAISTAIIAMAHQLGLEVVAEGVERQAQEEFLREHDCDQLQGYLFGKPVDAAATTELLRHARR